MKAIEHIVNNYVFRDSFEKVAGDSEDILEKARHMQEKIATELQKPDFGVLSNLGLTQEESLILKIASEYES